MKFCFVLAAAAALTGSPAAAEAPGLAGAYLVAREAQERADFAAAAPAWRAAAALDPANVRLAEKAIGAAIAAGDLEAAMAPARDLFAAGTRSQMAAMALTLGMAHRGEWDALGAAQADGLSVGPLVDGLSAGWVRLARGDRAGALAAFDAVAATAGLRTFGLMHKAYALGALGEDAAAEAVWSGEASGGAPLRLNRRAAEARIAGLARLGRTDDALFVMRRLFPGAGDPGIAALRAAVEAGTPPPAPIADGRGGLSETFLAVAAALRGEATDGYTLLYARAADMLSGGGDATILSANLLNALGRPDEAAALLETVPAGAHWHVARMDLARTLIAAGRADEAIGILGTLAAAHPSLAEAHGALGDALRGRGRPLDAASAYTAAIAAHGERAAWRLHFARALARDTAGDWDGARADLVRALEIEPAQPRVQNYLGHAMAARGEDPAGALALVRAAAAAQPENGLLADGLGWVLLRMGRPEEALPHLERAASLLPGDAAVLGHLGDGYWAVGRHREARFQWRRALMQDPPAEMADALEGKLRHGPSVPEQAMDLREREGAAPAVLASDG